MRNAIASGLARRFKSQRSDLSSFSPPHLPALIIIRGVRPRCAERPPLKKKKRLQVD